MWYLQDEGGEELLKAIVDNKHSSAKIKELSNLVLSNIETWRRKKDTEGLEELEEIWI